MYYSNLNTLEDDEVSMFIADPLKDFVKNSLSLLVSFFVQVCKSRASTKKESHGDNVKNFSKIFLNFSFPKNFLIIPEY